ncbi:unnamed protein product [Bursaphelenchus okinawaensis]|uniref:CHCH domain-containing protein n=1 Tax=Bursaphelenchus okinawaensis TaxID=465554 RepID=A0A811KBX8_9BILA|nr:unnamed protein product [Bursaphelenchus okinawaensis]CAG9097939.1 unnamed protein product [Bursaphelenchus okinawaensis]
MISLNMWYRIMMKFGENGQQEFEQKTSKSSKSSSKSASPPPKKEPGLLGQMAATAGTTAVGSAVGHAVGHSLIGGHKDSPKQSDPMKKPCEEQWQQYVDCLEVNKDPQLCRQLLDLFIDCRKKTDGK